MTSLLYLSFWVNCVARIYIVIGTLCNCCIRLQSMTSVRVDIQLQLLGGHVKVLNCSPREQHSQEKRSQRPGFFRL